MSHHEFYWKVIDAQRIIGNGAVFKIDWSCTIKKWDDHVQLQENETWEDHPYQSKVRNGTYNHEDDGGVRYYPSPDEPRYESGDQTWIPYEQLTEEDMLGWIQNHRESKKENIEGLLLIEVEGVYVAIIDGSVFTARGLPWDNTTSIDADPVDDSGHGND